MMVGAHHDRIDGMGIRPASEHLADRAAAALRRFKRGVDPVFPQMVDKRGSGLHDRIGRVVRHRDHPDGCRSLKSGQRIADGPRGTGGVIPGDHDVLELRSQLVDLLFRTEQQRPAGFEQERFDDALRLTVMRPHGNQRQIAEARMLGQDRRDLVRRHLTRSALGANVAAGGCIGEGVEELLHVAYLTRIACLRGIQIARADDRRPRENIFLERERGDPGAEVGGDSHACRDRSEGRPARLADKRQKDILDGHRDSPYRSG